MQIRKSPLFIAVLLVFSVFSSFAGNGHDDPSLGPTKESIKKDIDHHLEDTHDFHLFDYQGHPVGFPLPVILWDEGLHFFMSSKFDHGHKRYESNGQTYMMYHGKIYNVEENVYITETKVKQVTSENGRKTEDVKYTDTIDVMSYEAFYENNIETHAELGETVHLGNDKPLDFSITKNVFFIILISLLLLWMFASAARKYKKGLAPRGIAKFLEPLVIFVRDEIAIPNIGEKHYKRFMGFLLTVFFFIWLVNLFGLTPLGVNVTNNIAVTFALALLTFLITQFTGKKNYWMHIFWMPGVPWPMKIILMPIELLGVIIKPFALMIRLFANITAGHIVLMSILSLIFLFQNWLGGGLSFVLAIVLSILELLVAALQAYIFTMLSALYFGSAVEEHHDAH